MKKKITRVKELTRRGLYSYNNILYVAITVFGSLIMGWEIVLLPILMIIITLCTRKYNTYWIEEKIK